MLSQWTNKAIKIFFPYYFTHANAVSYFPCHFNKTFAVKDDSPESRFADVCVLPFA